METAPFRASRCSPAPASRGQVECEDKGGDQYGALDEILHVVRGVHHGQPLKKNTHEQRTCGRAEGVRPGGAKHREPDEGGSHAVEQEIVARGDVATAETRGQQTPWSFAASASTISTNLGVDLRSWRKAQSLAAILTASVQRYRKDQSSRVPMMIRATSVAG